MRKIGAAVTEKRATRRRDLSTDRIVSAAIEVAERDGESALTMRRVAEACGVTPMALYHHVSDKDELLTLVADHAVGHALAGGSGDAGTWRDRLVEFGCRFRQSLLDSPVAAAVFLRRPILSENLARATEKIFHLLHEGGLRGQTLAEAADAFVLLTMGSIANDTTRPPGVRDRLPQFLSQEDAPLLTQRLDDYSHRDPEGRYRVALGWMLDGLAAQIDAD